MKYTKSHKSHSHVYLAEVLYGIKSHEGCSDLFDSARGYSLPVQTSPLAEYVNDVNRFLFSGGIGLSSYGDLVEEHPALKYCEDFIKKTNPLLGSLWEVLAITGEVLVIPRLTSKGFSAEYFDVREYDLDWDKDTLLEATIKTITIIDGARYVYMFKVDHLGYYNYPLVLEREAPSYDWDANLEFVPHDFGFCPAVQIKVNPSIKSHKGQSEFTKAALNLAKSIVGIEYGLDENLEFFGHPIIDSPDPKRTTEQLNKKSQVLQKLPPDEGGSHELLQPVPITSDQLEYLKFKKSEFKRLLGISNTQETKFSDPSGTALRLMNDGLISKAQTKWQEIVEGGLEPLLDMLIWMGSKLNWYPLGNLVGKPLIKLQRNQPYFSLSDQEKVSALNVAQMLVDLGVDRVHALKETYYPHLTIPEIEDRLRINLEDI